MHRHRGFTLIEIVIAVLITAILFDGLRPSSRRCQSRRLQHNSERLQAVQF
jgi:prepilin-type N-terminal cleavage/methylation domain-containing protein